MHTKKAIRDKSNTKVRRVMDGGRQRMAQFYLFFGLSLACVLNYSTGFASVVSNTSTEQRSLAEGKENGVSCKHGESGVLLLNWKSEKEENAIRALAQVGWEVPSRVEGEMQGVSKIVIKKGLKRNHTDTGKSVCVKEEERVASRLMQTGYFEYVEPNYEVPLPPYSFEKWDPRLHFDLPAKGLGAFHRWAMEEGLPRLPNDPLLSEQWHHFTMDTVSAWEIETGSSQVVVAVCDTGVESQHADLRGNILAGFNTVDGSGNSEPVAAHGTLVAGVIAGVGNNGNGGAGIAYSTKILPVRVSNKSDGGSSQDALDKCIRQATDRGAKVINISYRVGDSKVIDAASKYARGKGTQVFVGAGNDSQTVGYEDFTSFLLISATDSSDQKATFTNIGTAIDLAAPGVFILSTTPGGGYGHVSGTSFACPAAAGVAALLYALKPGATPDQVETWMRGSAVDLGPGGEDITFGSGRVDAAMAVASANAQPGNQAPLAKAEAEPRQGLAPLVVQFHSDKSGDPDGTIIRKRWTLPDGSVISGEGFEKEFKKPGKFRVRLSVWDNQGTRTDDSLVIRVGDEPDKVYFVESIDLTKVVNANGREFVDAHVRILDVLGNPVSGAKLSFRFAGDVSGTNGKAATDENGWVVVRSPRLKDTHHLVTFSIRDAVKRDWIYQPDLNKETEDQIQF